MTKKTSNSRSKGANGGKYDWLIDIAKTAGVVLAVEGVKELYRWIKKRRKAKEKREEADEKHERQVQRDKEEIEKLQKKNAVCEDHERKMQKIKREGRQQRSNKKNDLESTSTPQCDEYIKKLESASQLIEEDFNVSSHEVESDKNIDMCLVGKFILKGTSNIIVAPEGIGKSIFSTQIAFELSEGKSSLILEGEHINKQPIHVRFIETETEPRIRNERYGNYAVNTAYFQYFPHANFASYKYALEQLIPMVHDDIQTHRDTFYCIDDVLALFPTLAGNQAWYFLSIVNMLIKEAYEAGVTITFLYVMHTNSTPEYCKLSRENLKGSKDWNRFVRSTIALTQAGDLRKLTFVKSNVATEEKQYAYYLNIVDEPYVHYEFHHKNKETAPIPKSQPHNRADKDRKKLKEWKNDNKMCGKVRELKLSGLSDYKVADELGLQQKDIQRWWKENKEQNK